jgi:3-oxoacyl-[acyl-carrier protein] reductase
MTPRLDLSLKGRSALVCGASAGIGLASAQTLASQGARVVLLARREGELKKALSSLPGEGHSYMVCDLLDRASLGAKVSSKVAELGGAIEILICNSSGPKAGAIVDAEEQAFEQTFAQQLLASHVLVKTLIPGMRSRKYGRIINVISTSVKIPIAGLGVSNTIRAAVASWAKTLSLEVAADGITVNSVLPGYTETDRLLELLRGGAKAQGKTEEALREEWKRQIPMRRFADPSELASVIGFFASPAASYVTGTALAVDGGRTGTI